MYDKKGWMFGFVWVTIETKSAFTLLNQMINNQHINVQITIE